jgi:hypothetical protein
MRRNQLMLALLGLGLALALVGCGGSPDGDRVASLSGAGATGTTRAPADGASRDPEQAAPAFARCMRQHGVDMPDPEVDDQGRMTMRIGGPGAKPDPRKLEAAQKACGTPFGGDGPGRLDPRARDAMVDYARCMREHGVDMPDPTDDGGLVIGKRAGQGKGDGPDPESPKFQAADRACGHHLNAIGKPGTSGGRP